MIGNGGTGRRMRIAIFGGKGGAEIAAHSIARLAEAWPGIALVGFTRPDRCVVYAGDHRLGV